MSDDVVAMGLGHIVNAAQKASQTGQEQGATPKQRAIPPVHLWEPDYCGDIGLKIAYDGQWSYAGSPIGRQKLVDLFSTILRFDDDGEYYLVTPAEKIRVEVEDAPFIAIAMTVLGQGTDQIIRFSTNVGDHVEASEAHPLRFVIDPETQTPAPYVHIRARLEARINRPVFYDLVNLGSTHEGHFGVWSDGVFFPMMPADELEL